jgi:oligosaccharyltransferase complex subunit gamma
MTAISIITGISLLGLLILKASVIFQTTKIWSYFSIIFTTIMCSGYMWTTIRHPPYMGRGQHGEAQVWAGGSQYQFGVETTIVASLYLLISLTFGILVFFVPYMSSPRAQRYTVYFFSTAFLTLYSVLLMVFKGKNGGYPFKLFF